MLFPGNTRQERGLHIKLVLDMLPRVKAEGLAEYCDVFVEQGAFSSAQARTVLERARNTA
jgi:imidazolonepropionase